MKKHPVVMISSTVHDLPDYREKVMDGCWRADMFPKMMERLTAMNADAVEASLKMVDEADVYLGIFAHRYGTIPDGHEVSITELEYDRAVGRNIPRLIFVMSDEVPVKPKDFATGEAQTKLNALKARLQKNNVVALFEEPQHLKGLVLQALNEIKIQLEETTAEDENSAKAAAASFHYVSAIPTKGEPYIAHPYTLLQVKGLIGRKAEQELLTDWITKPRFKDTTIFNVVAIGGMGKSALTWTWFNDIAPQEKEWAGRAWWSFYESDASFENFVTRTLAYVSGQPLESFKNMPFPDQQMALLNELNKAPYLLVLDGLERILIAYARQDAAYMLDDHRLDEESANRVAGAYGLPESASKSFVGKHQLRKTADVRAGQFLRKLAQVQNSRILVSTRLYPADLQLPDGRPGRGCFAAFLPGLSDQDALALWRAYSAKGSRDKMLPIFRTFDKHPLLLKLLAYEVAEFREAPGDFDAWRAANPDFNPFELPLVQVQSEVLAHALQGLTAAERKTLQVIAGFRMPAAMETVKALLICSDKKQANKSQPFVSLRELDQSLTILEDRGLLGWDRRANRYDLHPIVRGVVWGRLDEALQCDIYNSLYSHFEAMPMIKDFMEIESIENLTPAIELYSASIGLELYEDAFKIYYDRLEKAMLWRLSANRLRIELLERLFPDGINMLPYLTSENYQVYVLNTLAMGYILSGQPGLAVKPLLHQLEITKSIDDYRNHAVGLINTSNATRFLGLLYKSESASTASLKIQRNLGNRFNEASSLYFLGRVLARCGRYEESRVASERALRILIDLQQKQAQGPVSASLVEVALWQESKVVVQPIIKEVRQLAESMQFEHDLIRSQRLQGMIALHSLNWESAVQELNMSLTKSRAVELVEEELPTLIALAELHRQQEEPDKACERLEDVWELAERGPYPLFHADALNVLARIEQDAGNTPAAIEAASEAYRKAWCDGPPYAYDYGLRTAKEILASLGAPEPEMPPFDPSKFEPMPEIEINPDDEFGGEA